MMWYAKRMIVIVLHQSPTILQPVDDCVSESKSSFVNVITDFMVLVSKQEYRRIASDLDVLLTDTLVDSNFK